MSAFKIIILFLLSISASSLSVAQGSTLFLEPEFMIGKAVPHYSPFPHSGIRTTYAMNIGRYHDSSERNSHCYYNFPHTGLMLAYSDLANRDVLGSELSVVPYIVLNASQGLRNAWSFKLGLGGSYYTKPFHEQENPGNKMIGSAINYTFLAFLYHTFWLPDRSALKLGAGFWHSSNAHTQIPNYGINSALLTVAYTRYLGSIDPNMVRTKPDHRSVNLFVQSRAGAGMHEFAGSISPVGGPKRPVYTYAAGVGRLYNEQLKVYMGFLYRYYQSYAEHFKGDGNLEHGEVTPSASCVNLFVEMEYLFGHVGMNVGGGINLYRPYYKVHYSLYESGNAFNEFRMSYISTRMGINLYLKNTNRRPKHNLALGTHVNANFGKADFGELSLTYVKILR